MKNRPFLPLFLDLTAGRQPGSQVGRQNNGVFENYKNFLHVKLFSYLRPSFVTGFWKTDQLVTLGLLRFIGPANCYTQTLPIHSAFTTLD